MSLFEKFQQGLSYADFLARYGSANDQARWKRVYDQVVLTDAQRELLRSFRRQMNVLCLAGAWCGDCAGQCPAFERFAEAAPVIKVRFLDRDDHDDVQRELQINGGNRVPVAVFFSEDGFEAARYGERTLTRYRQLMAQHAGEGCPTGIVRAGDPVLAQVVQEWLNEFERVQWMLRLSPRLRQKHGD
jgi:thiol-disulfide isomerase/thioredoxin